MGSGCRGLAQIEPSARGFRAQRERARLSSAYQLEAVLLAQKDGARLGDTRPVAPSRGVSWLAALIRGRSRPCCTTVGSPASDATGIHTDLYPTGFSRELTECATEFGRALSGSPRDFYVGIASASPPVVLLGTARVPAVETAGTVQCY